MKAQNYQIQKKVELNWLWSFTGKYHLHSHIGWQYEGFPIPHPCIRYVQRNKLLSNLKWPDSSGEERKEGGFCTSQFKCNGAGQQGTDVHTSPLRLLSRRLLFCRARSGGEAGPVLAEERKASSICGSAACEGSWLSKRLVLKFNSPWCVLAGTHTCWWAAWIGEQCWNPPVPSPRYSLLCVCLPVVLLKTHST